MLKNTLELRACFETSVSEGIYLSKKKKKKEEKWPVEQPAILARCKTIKYHIEKLHINSPNK